MNEFYQWAIFLGFIALIVIVLYAFAAGYIHTPRTRTDSFKEWQKLNGRVVRMMCLLMLVVCVSIAIYKYYQVNETLNAPPSLESD